MHSECYCGDLIWKVDGRWQNAAGRALCYPGASGPDGDAEHEPISQEDTP